MSEQWYWCLRHSRPEQTGKCPVEHLLGPYDSEEAARSWRSRVEQRNETWEEDDERWHGRPDD